jgi:hypothetical protein
MKSKLKTALAAMVGMVLLGATNAGATPITYAVALFEDVFFGIAIGGSITTDGTLGIIGIDNIVDWNLIGVTQGGLGNNLFNSTGPLSGNNASAFGARDILATPLTLALNGSDPFSFFDVFADSSQLIDFSLQGNIHEGFIPSWGICINGLCNHVGLDATGGFSLTARPSRERCPAPSRVLAFPA